MQKPVFKRILLKISGEALAGEKGFGFDYPIISNIARQIKEISKLGVECGIVIGAGNIFRGAYDKALDRNTADTTGMLATIINSIVFKTFLEKENLSACVFSSLPFPKGTEYFVAEKAIRFLESKGIAIIAGGTGNPYFTTDTAAALRCAELKADVLLKATKVDGIYDKDPIKNSDAKKFVKLTHGEALEKKLKVMDATAFAFCMENNIPIIVFKLLEKDSLKSCVLGLPVGTIVNKGD
jgi:uridylate kinase